MGTGQVRQVLDRWGGHWAGLVGRVLDRMKGTGQVGRALDRYDGYWTGGTGTGQDWWDGY